jgi:hypothetical protein
MGRAIVLMPGPYDSHSKKVNEVNKYDVFGSHKALARVGSTNDPIHCRERLVGMLNFYYREAA